MKIRPSRFCIPVSNGAPRSDARRFSKVPNHSGAPEKFFAGAGTARGPSARFRDWRRGEAFRRRGRRAYVFFDEVPDRRRHQERDQLGAPVLQSESGPQDGNQCRAPVLRDLS